MYTKHYFILFLTVLFYSSCGDGSNTNKKDSHGETNVETPVETRLALSISKRQLFVLEGNDTTKRFAISVGKQGHPTPQGEFEIHQIDWNPDWTPPESEWAKDETYKKPGEDGNPMGRARIIYEMPYTLHGTKDTASLGKAESHGSVRMDNKDVIELGKFLMEKSGTNKDNDWFTRVLGDSTKMESVKLVKPIKLTNVE